MSSLHPMRPATQQCTRETSIVTSERTLIPSLFSSTLVSGEVRAQGKAAARLTILAAGCRRHGSHLSKRSSECKCKHPRNKVHPNCSSKPTIGERKRIAEQHSHPRRHGGDCQSKHRQRLEVSPQLLRSAHTCHVEGVSVGASRRSGSIDSDSVV